MPSPSTVLLRTQSDERLVALVRAGHERAFDAIVERYRKPLLRACARILPEARAEDALQQTLMAAWKGLQRGDDIHDLRPWLYRIARNTALNQLRVAGYDLDELVETLSATHDPEEEVVRRAVVRQTLAAVAALPERQREALLRTAVEGRGQDEVARDLGLSDTAVRALVHRARVRVRAAATALVPLPLVTWAAAGAGGTGAAVTLAKAGTLAVLAGGAVTVPAVIHEHGGRTRAATAHAAPKPRAHVAKAAAATPTPAARAERVAASRPAAAPARAPRHAADPAPSERERADAPRSRERERSGPGSGEDVDSSGHDAQGSSGHDEHGSSGPGGDGSSGHGGDDGSSHRGPGGGGGGGGSSGPGSGDDAAPVTAATATPAPTPTPTATTDPDDHRGHGGGDDDDLAP
jgi:RNA polymerase sigma factor (sigma-70 family)